MRMRVAGTYKVGILDPLLNGEGAGAVLLNEADESDAPGKPPSRQLTCECMCIFESKQLICGAHLTGVARSQLLKLPPGQRKMLKLCSANIQI